MSIFGNKKMKPKASTPTKGSKNEKDVKDLQNPKKVPSKGKVRSAVDVGPGNTPRRVTVHRKRSRQSKKRALDSPIPSLLKAVSDLDVKSPANGEYAQDTLSPAKSPSQNAVPQKGVSRTTLYKVVDEAEDEEASPGLPLKKESSKDAPLKGNTRSVLYNIVDKTNEEDPLKKVESKTVENVELKKTKSPSPAPTDVQLGASRSVLYKVLDQTEEDEKKNKEYELKKTQSGSQKHVAFEQKVLDKTQGENKDVEQTRSILQLPHVPPTTAGETFHPLSCQKIDFDLIGRTGMYLERQDLSSERKQSYDWMAFHRHSLALTRTQDKLSHHLGEALSEIGIQKALFLDTVQKLKDHGSVLPEELEKIKKKLSKEKPILTMSKAAWILKTNCTSYSKPQKNLVKKEKDSKK